MSSFKPSQILAFIGNQVKRSGSPFRPRRFLILKERLLKCLVQEIKMSAKKVIKKFECPVCDKVFTDKSNLLEHKKSIHQGVTYNCDQCDQTYSYRSSL